MDSVYVSGFHVGSGVVCVWISGFCVEAGLGADAKFVEWAFLSIFGGEVCGKVAVRPAVGAFLFLHLSI